MIKKPRSILWMPYKNKLSELWHTSVNYKARPVVEGEHNKRAGTTMPATASDIALL